MNAKQRAAEAAIELIESDCVVGLGTGSTADFFLVALAHALTSGRLRGIRGVPTSQRSEQRAMELGIPVVGLGDVPRVDITVDGADEISDQLDLIKGLGGALLREKIVAQNSSSLVIIADESKLSGKLGTRSALPVEVAIFGYESHATYLRGFGCEPTLRRVKENGKPYLTDNDNYVYDCGFARPIDDPSELDRGLRRRAGIVETGLFTKMATLVLVGSDDGTVRRLARHGG